MEMTSCLFRKDVPRPRSVSARFWDARNEHSPETISQWGPSPVARASSHKHLTGQREPCTLHPLTFITWRLPHVQHPSHTYQREPRTPHMHSTHIHTVHTTPSRIQPLRTSIYTTSLAQTHIITSHIPYTHTHTPYTATQHTTHLPTLNTLHIHCLPPIPHVYTHESQISQYTPTQTHYVNCRLHTYTSERCMATYTQHPQTSTYTIPRYRPEQVLHLTHIPMTHNTYFPHKHMPIEPRTSQPPKHTHRPTHSKQRSP